MARLSDTPQPTVILLANGFTRRERYQQALRALEGGVMWVHLRDHEAGDSAFFDGATRFVKEVRRQHPGVRVSVNSRLSVAEALGTGYHGGFRGAAPQEARERLGTEAVIGYSAHDLGDVTGPMREHVDYYFYSPIFPTGSKPGHAGVGVDELAGVCERSEVSVYALGGITPERVASCTEAGAAGVAVLSGIMEAADPAEAASAYVRQMKG